MLDTDEGMELHRACSRFGQKQNRPKIRPHRPKIIFLKYLEILLISDIFGRFFLTEIFSDRKSVEDSNGIFYSIRINDIIVHIEQNKDPRAFENVKVYAGLKIAVI